MRCLSASVVESGVGEDHLLAVGPQGGLTLGTAIQTRASLYNRQSSGNDASGGVNIAVSIRSSFEFVRAIFALDGLVARILFLAPTLPKATISTLMARESIDLLITDRSDVQGACAFSGTLEQLKFHEFPIVSGTVSEWLMTTSGTTGTPKIVRHTLESLAAKVHTPRTREKCALWGLLYDPSRFAGMQVVLHALLGKGTLILPDPEWAWDRQLAFLAELGCTHLSATPTLWRKILMSSEDLSQTLQQITLGGEIADQPLLNALISRYPNARVTHIYASTEAGVGFSIHDGRAGFPVQLISEASESASLKVVDGVLWLRPVQIGSARPRADHIVRDEHGYICTSDCVQIKGDRVLFVGRESGTVNIGGTKIRMEEIENIVRHHPEVSDCVIVAKPSPVMGTILALTVVPKRGDVDKDYFLAEIRKWCKEKLQREAQPASIKVEQFVTLGSSGKLSRNIVQ